MKLSEEIVLMQHLQIAVGVLAFGLLLLAIIFIERYIYLQNKNEKINRKWMKVREANPDADKLSSDRIIDCMAIGAKKTNSNSHKLYGRQRDFEQWNIENLIIFNWLFDDGSITQRFIYLNTLEEVYYAEVVRYLESIGVKI